MDIGDTYLLADPQIDEHLWVVISHPAANADEVVIVSLTTFDRLKDSSCILEPGDHPWIRHQTCVAYEYARCVKEAEIDRLVQQGHLTPREPASDTLLGKILAGANVTEAMPNKCRKVLAEQDLIEL